MRCTPHVARVKRSATRGAFAPPDLSRIALRFIRATDCIAAAIARSASAPARHLAEHIPKARFIELDGADHFAFAGDSQAVLDSIRPFVDELAG